MVLFRVVSIGSKKEDPINNLLGIAGLHNVCDYPFEAATSHIQNTIKTHNIIIWLCSTDKHGSEQYKPVPWKSLLYEWHYTAWETFINIPYTFLFRFINTSNPSSCYNYRTKPKWHSNGVLSISPLKIRAKKEIVTRPRCFLRSAYRRLCMRRFTTYWGGNSEKDGELSHIIG